MIGLAQFRLPLALPVGTAGRLPGLLLASGLGVAVLAAPDPGRGQAVAPSEVTPPSLRPPPAQAGEGLVLPGLAPLQPPPDSGNFDVLVGRVNVEGTFPEVARPTRALVAGVVGRRLTTTQIFAFATALEAAYTAAGFSLVRVTVPPQHIDDHGTLRILVIDGFIESIDVKNVPRRVRHVVLASVRWLIGRRHVTLHQVERALLIASDLPGVTLRSAFAPGTSEGGTKLIIEGVQHLVTGTFGLNDRLPASLGIWQYSGNVAINSPLGFGEQFYATFGVGADLRRAFAGKSPLHIYGGGVVVPLGPDGFAINPEYTHTRSETLPGPSQIQSAGELDRYALHLVDPLIRTRRTNLAFEVALEQIVQRSFIPSLDANISLDRYTVVRLGPDFTTIFGSGTWLEIRFTTSRGLGGRSAAKAAAAGLPLSTFGAASDFTKFTGTFHITQPLPRALRLDVIGHAQDSLGKPLLKAEQFSPNATDAVSAFADATFNFDQGETIRAELGRGFVLPAYQRAASLTPYVFAAAAQGRLMRATALEQPITNLAAVGIGTHGAVQAKAGMLGANLDVELARQFSDVAGMRQGWRANVNLVLSF